MRRSSAVAWIFMVLAAILMGGLLIVSDERGATAGRWHLAFAAAGLGFGVLGWGHEHGAADDPSDGFWGWRGPTSIR